MKSTLLCAGLLMLISGCGSRSSSGAGGAGVGGSSGAAGASGIGGAATLGGSDGGGHGTGGSPETARDAAPPDAPTSSSDAAHEANSGAALEQQIVETLDISDVWSGQRVNFSLVTVGDQQFAAFCDANRMMTVAQRTLGSPNWTLTTLATMLGWDSHNHVVLAVDSAGLLHVSGNMHGVPLIYFFRSTRPLDASSLVRVTAMVGTNEQACTYPQFFRGPTGNLIFAYRDGGGNGNYIFDSWNATARAWTRLINTPLIDGQNTYSAYPVGPLLGPDGYYHIVWVWRDTADAATNHDISYMKSRDLLSWQTVDGRALTLPITFAQSPIVDPVPAGGGMINNNTKIGFDAQGRAIIAYHKYDGAGNTQLYDARFENGAWAVHHGLRLDLPLGVRRPRDAGVPDRDRGAQAAEGRLADPGVVSRAVRRLGRVPARPGDAAPVRDDSAAAALPRGAGHRSIHDARHAGPLVAGQRRGTGSRAFSTCCAGRPCPRIRTSRVRPFHLQPGCDSMEFARPAEATRTSKAAATTAVAAVADGGFVPAGARLRRLARSAGEHGRGRRRRRRHERRRRHHRRPAALPTVAM